MQDKEFDPKQLIRIPTSFDEWIAACKRFQEAAEKANERFLEMKENENNRILE